MKKLIYPLAVTVALMCVLLTGCGGNDNGGSTRDTRTSERDSSSSTSYTTSSTTYSTSSNLVTDSVSGESMFDVQDGRVSDTRSIID